mmetsp:Transcript_21861/g.61079  ORF Transcript_21861/g.61079 Transcript_21861/m.61079 type:complete len:149 (-) Transcript_21861:927-1373(-)
MILTPWRRRPIFTPRRERAWPGRLSTGVVVARIATRFVAVHVVTVAAVARAVILGSIPVVAIAALVVSVAVIPVIGAFLTSRAHVVTAVAAPETVLSVRIALVAPWSSIIATVAAVKAILTSGAIETFVMPVAPIVDRAAVSRRAVRI